MISKQTNNDFLKVLDNCLFVGAILIVENIGENIDPMLLPLL